MIGPPSSRISVSSERIRLRTNDSRVGKSVPPDAYTRGIEEMGDEFHVNAFHCYIIAIKLDIQRKLLGTTTERICAVHVHEIDIGPKESTMSSTSSSRILVIRKTRIASSVARLSSNIVDTDALDHSCPYGCRGIASSSIEDSVDMSAVIYYVMIHPLSAITHYTALMEVSDNNVQIKFLDGGWSSREATIPRLVTAGGEEVLRYVNGERIDSTKATHVERYATVSEYCYVGVRFSSGPTVAHDIFTGHRQAKMEAARRMSNIILAVEGLLGTVMDMRSN
ncbi:hypothetical protein K474DRAFT_1680420 [Panus rudis PR-1116 ss-1]|nr:hypothetical protein K474DRAFT_1680420 [Panus rudis PR-1116 ss-1]